MEPFDDRTALQELWGFSVRAIRMDLLHLVHIGVARDVIGGILVRMVRSGAFGAGSIEARLSTAFGVFLRFCGRKGDIPSLENFSRERLSWGPTSYPEMSCKGSDATLLALSSYMAMFCSRSEGLGRKRRNTCKRGCSQVQWLQEECHMVLQHYTVFRPRLPMLVQQLIAQHGSLALGADGRDVC